MKYASSLGEVEYIRTGLFIDRITGGLPRGRITELWGDESTGKTTIVLQFIAEAQRQGLKCLFVDAEHSFEPSYARALGVALDNLALIEEEVAEDALNELLEVMGKFDVVVIDSIGALRTRLQAEKQLGEKTIGSQAGLVANFARDLATMARYKNTCVVGINHSFVDIMSGKLMTSGGKKWQYFKALSIRLKSAGKLVKQGENVVGKVIEATITKDKVRGNERASVEGTIMFKEGFQISRDTFDEALRKDILKKVGNTYWFNEIKLGVGKVSASNYLKDNEDTATQIKAIVDSF